jgi:hypothetical protein
MGKRSMLVMFLLEDSVWSPTALSVALLQEEGRPVPEVVWAVESELCDHKDVGQAAVFGIPVCPFTIEAWQSLPMDCQFASITPPIVLYHGTGLAAARAISRKGLRPGSASAQAMLGPGVYLARWNKASDFGRHTVDNIMRMEPGIVARVLLCGIGGAGSAPNIRQLTRHDVCTCGCARAFVDHEGLQARGFAITMVPDHAGSATRRAEWCVRQPELLVVLSFVQVCMPLTKSPEVPAGAGTRAGTHADAGEPAGSTSA